MVGEHWSGGGILNETEDPIPLLPEASIEELFHELRKRVDVSLLAYITGSGTTEEGLTYFYSGSPYSVLGLSKIVGSELTKALTQSLSSEDDEGEEWKETSQ